ncbi:MAG: hypothetical protein ABI874_05225, partial [Chloroflexota bacterium]
MSDAPTLIVFSAGATDDEAERLVTLSRRAITADVVARARALHIVERIVVATDSRELIATLQPYDVIADYDDDGQTFTFGHRLAQIIERYDVRKPFYIGGGAGALLTDDELRSIADRLRAADNILIPNNYWSADFVAFAPGRAAIGLPPLETDNNLAFLLRTERDLVHAPQPRTLGTQFDVDTPTDVLLLRYAKNLGAHTRAFLDATPLDTAHVERLLPHLTQRTSELLVSGRVAAEVWRYFETQIACRTRLLSEERGLLASGREARGEARSLLGFLFDTHDSAAAFALLGELCTATLIDARVLLAHRRIKSSAHDRFNADLLRPELIANDWLRDFTAAAIRAPMPVILGGHSLVCGGLYLL